MGIETAERSPQSSARPSLRQVIVFIYRLSVLFWMSFTASLILTFAASFVVFPLSIFENVIPEPLLDPILFITICTILACTAWLGRARLHDLSAAFGRKHGLAYWMRNAAWVNGWVFAMLTSLVILLSIIRAGDLGLTDGEIRDVPVAFEGYLLGIDMVLSSVLFDVMEVFDLHLASIRPEGIGGRGLVVVGKLVVGITFIRSAFTLWSFEESPRMRMWLDDLGWLGTATLTMFGIFLMAVYITLEDVLGRL